MTGVDDWETTCPPAMGRSRTLLNLSPDRKETPGVSLAFA